LFTSSYLAALYLKTYFPEKKKAYVIGGKGIIEELGLAGIEPIGGPQDKNMPMNTELFKKLEVDPEIGAVVIFIRNFDVTQE